jgi:hypothetical protein
MLARLNTLAGVTHVVSHHIDFFSMELISLYQVLPQVLGWY